MTKPSDNITIPSGLGITQEGDEFILDLGETPQKKAKNALAWILGENYTGFDIPTLSRLAYLQDTPPNKSTIIIGKTIRPFQEVKSKYIDVEISRDAMKAWLHIKKPSPGIQFTEGDCLLILLRNGVRVGFDMETMQAALDNGLPAFRVVAAIGREPKSGNEGEIIYHELIDWDLPTLSTHPFHVVTVQENEILAQKLPPGPIEHGYTVTGQHIPYKPESLKFPAGENTHLSEDGLTLYASVDGYISLDNGKISVKEGLRIPGDIDYNSGNISYHGKIIIEGDVRAGHQVHSDSDIEVFGCIEGANVSSGGNIMVHNGINGLEKSLVTADGNIHTDYIQDANVIAEGDVLIERYVSRSVIEAYGNIQVDVKAGLIRGGVTWSEKLVTANVAGSTACIPTTIKIQPNLKEEQQQEVQVLSQRLHMLEDEQSQIRRRLDYLTLLERRQQHLDTNYQEEAQILAEKIVDISQEIMSLEDKQEALQSIKTRAVDPEEPFIIIRKKIYPGVRFIVGEHEMLVQEEIDGGKICLLNNQLFLKRTQQPPPEKKVPLYQGIQ